MMENDKYKYYFDAVDEILEQGRAGEYIDFTIFISYETALRFHFRIQDSMIRYFENLRDSIPGNINYDAQRELHEEGKYMILEKKLRTIVQQPDQQLHLFVLNQRDVNTLGHVMGLEHYRYGGGIEFGTDNDREIFAREANMFLDFLENVERADGTYRPYYKDYFNNVALQLREMGYGMNDEGY